MPLPNFDLYLITDRKLTRGRDLCAVIEQALDGGVKAIQLREKDLDGKEIFGIADKISMLCQRYNAQLFVNDRIDVALAVDAAGVQLGKTSLPIEAARALLGPAKLIGYSTHAAHEAKDAERSGADFILFGPVFFTPSKAPFGAPQGLAPLKETVAQVALPVYAIGGIKSENLVATMTTGCRGVALISAIMSAENPCAAARVILTMLAE
ncbi:MAG: thiamine phosphate synthase [Candidatus Binatia bacterium]